MMKGEVTSGKGDGKYYIGMDEYQKAFHEVLGYYPYHGTLNLKVDPEERRELEESIKPEIISEVYHQGERLSDVKVYSCRIEEIKCAALRLEKTDHPESIMEVVAEKRLRDKLDLEDGDMVAIAKE